MLTVKGRRQVATAMTLLATLAAALLLMTTLFGNGAEAAGVGPVTWGTPGAIDGQAPFGAPDAFVGLSCPTTTLCVGTTRFGETLVSTNPTSTAWSSVSSLSGFSGSSVSCAVVSGNPVCTVGGGTNGTVSQDLLVSSTTPAVATSWSVDVISGGGGVTAVQCLPDGICFAVDHDGDVLSNGGGHWHISSAPVDTGAPFVSLSCVVHTTTPAVTNACVALDAAGNAYQSTTPATLTAQSWTLFATGLPDGNDGVSCTSASYCVSASQTGQLLAGAVHTQPTYAPALTTMLLARITCVPDSALPTTAAQALCLTGEQGVSGVYVSTNPSTLTLESFPAGTGVPTAISCPTDVLCFAGTSVGAITWANPASATGAGWSAATWAPGVLAAKLGSNYLNVSPAACPASNLCVAGDFGGRVFVSTNPGGGAATWASAQVDASAWISGLTCPATTLCVGIDSNGNVIASTNPAGGAGTFGVTSQVASKFAVLTCPATTLCVGYNGSGMVISSTAPAGGPGSWNVATTSISPSGPIQCPSTSLCVAADSGGSVFVSTNPTAPTWPSSPVDAPNAIAPMVCPSVGLCVGFDANGRLVSSTNPAAGPGSFTVSATPVTAQAVNRLACPSATLCVGIDAAGNVVSSTNPGGGAAAWSVTPTPIDTNWISSLTCPSTTLCLALDGAGNVAESTNPAGGATQWIVVPVDAGQSPLTLSCQASSLCLLTDLAGNVVTGVPVTSSTTTSTTSPTSLSSAVTSSTTATSSATPSATTTSTATTVTRTTTTTRRTSTPPSAPAAPPGIASVSRATARGTTVSARARCAGTATQQCVVTLTLKLVETLRGSKIVAVGAALRHRTVTIATQTLALSGGQATTAHLTVTGRTLLAQNPRFAARFAAAQGSTILRRQTVTIVAGRRG